MLTCPCRSCYKGCTEVNLFDGTLRGNTMFLPPQYAWLEPVIIAAVVVFVISWIGNTVTFSNRIASAFVTALIFGLIFAGLTYSGYGSVNIEIHPTPIAVQR
jgi:hypothetical protein